MVLGLNMMSDKSSNETPTTYVVTSAPSSNEKARPMSQSKKLIIIALSTVLVVGLIIAAVLIGIHLVTKSQLEIVEASQFTSSQFQTQFKTSDNQDAKQTTTSDPNANVVTYHVTKGNQDVYIVDDFNKGIQTVRVQSPSGTTCYVTPLNQSDAMNPAMITGPDATGGSSGVSSQPFIMSNTPVVDRSFMTPSAANLCNGVSVYWAYRACGGINNSNSTALNGDRKKRQIVNCGTYNGLVGLGDCCTCYFACKVSCSDYVSGGIRHCTCTVTTGTCCGVVAQPYCSNWYYASYTGGGC